MKNEKFEIKIKNSKRVKKIKSLDNKKIDEYLLNGADYEYSDYLIESFIQMKYGMDLWQYKKIITGEYCKFYHQKYHPDKARKGYEKLLEIYKYSNFESTLKKFENITFFYIVIHLIPAYLLYDKTDIGMLLNAFAVFPLCILKQDALCYNKAHEELLGKILASYSKKLQFEPTYYNELLKKYGYEDLLESENNLKK